jgi:hypothetical protein
MTVCDKTVGQSWDRRARSISNEKNKKSLERPTSTLITTIPAQDYETNIMHPPYTALTLRPPALMLQPYLLQLGNNTHSMALDRPLWLPSRASNPGFSIPIGDDLVYRDRYLLWSAILISAEWSGVVLPSFHCLKGVFFRTGHASEPLSIYPSCRPEECGQVLYLGPSHLLLASLQVKEYHLRYGDQANFSLTWSSSPSAPLRRFRLASRHF